MNIQMFLLVVGVVLALTCLEDPTADAKVQIIQSGSTTNDNGQRMSLKTESTSGGGSTVQEKISVPSGGTANFILKPGELKIYYCSEGGRR